MRLPLVFPSSVWKDSLHLLYFFRKKGHAHRASDDRFIMKVLVCFVLCTLQEGPYSLKQKIVFTIDRMVLVLQFQYSALQLLLLRDCFKVDCFLSWCACNSSLLFATKPMPSSFDRRADGYIVSLSFTLSAHRLLFSYLYVASEADGLPFLFSVNGREGAATRTSSLQNDDDRSSCFR